MHDPKGFEQSPQRKSTYDDPCKSRLAITTLVPRSNEKVHTTTNFIDLEERSLKNSKGINSSSCPKQNFAISSMDGLRARLQKEGASREASNLIKLRRSSSKSNYESPWGKWDSWCVEREIDSFCGNINQIPEFLSQLFQNGFQCRTINNYINPQYLLFMTTFKGSQWVNTPEFVLWLLVLLIVDLRNQGTILSGMPKQ